MTGGIRTASSAEAAAESPSMKMVASGVRVTEAWRGKGVGVSQWEVVGGCGRSWKVSGSGSGCRSVGRLWEVNRRLWGVKRRSGEK